MNALQEKLLEMTLDVKEVLDAHDVPFYVMYGTALGAVRHEGFIPWDDDVDLCIMNTDLDRFLTALEDGLDKEKYFLEIPETGDYLLDTYKIRLNGTTFIEPEYKDADIHHGIFIEFFVLDKINDRGLRKILYVSASRLYILIGYLYYKGVRNLIVKRSVGLLRWLRSRLVDIMTKLGTAPDGNTAAIRSWHVNENMFPASVFGTAKMMPFEDSLLPVPENVEVMLEHLYGNFMELPPEKDRNPIHNEYWNLDMDYKEYYRSR